MTVTADNYREHPMFEHVHQSNLIEGYDKPEADIQLLMAWEEMLVADEPFTHGWITRLQKWIVNHQTDISPHWRGYYRDLSKQRVWVGDREGLAPGLIKAAMDEWIEDVNYWLKKGDCSEAIIRNLHVRYEHIHPFVDGNGRSGRVLMWLMEVKCGLEPTLITYAERGKYYAWF